MSATYSTYDAKARFSEILRKVRRGEVVYITYRGREVAEIKPIEREETFEERLEKLRKRGVIVDALDRKAPLNPIARRPGALKRFLEERD
jgi:prevent-host-death family protein